MKCRDRFAFPVGDDTSQGLPQSSGMHEVAASLDLNDNGYWDQCELRQKPGNEEIARD